MDRGRFSFIAPVSGGPSGTPMGTLPTFSKKNASSAEQKICFLAQVEEKKLRFSLDVPVEHPFPEIPSSFSGEKTMYKATTTTICAILVLTCFASTGYCQRKKGGGTVTYPANIVQSPARPFGLPIIGNVQGNRSDARALAFHTTYFPTFQQIINDQLSESVVFSNASGFKLNASKLFLRTASDKPIRVYFLAEGAGYHNSLGFSYTPAGSPTPGTPYLIFPDASIGSSRSTWEPLQPGDFIDIGVGGNGWQLDFFVISNGVNGGTTWLWNDVDKNSDDLQHVVAFLLPGTPYVLIGFEDIVGGGDLDYNDALFVVDIGAVNAQNLSDEFANLPN